MTKKIVLIVADNDTDKAYKEVVSALEYENIEFSASIQDLETQENSYTIECVEFDEFEDKLIYQQHLTSKDGAEKLFEELKEEYDNDEQGICLYENGQCIKSTY